MQLLQPTILARGTGLALRDALVTVYLTGTTTKATLYSLNDVGSPERDNPYSTGNFGEPDLSIYVPDGVYDLRVDHSSQPTRTISEVQIYDYRELAEAVGGANVTALAGLTGAADKLPYFVGSGAMGVTDFTAAARTLLDDANVTAMRATLGLTIGTHVQAYSAELTTLAAVGVTAFGASLLELADATALSALVTADVSALTTRVNTHDLLLGTAESALNLGTFTGTTIADSVSVKVALQSLETAVETAVAGAVVMASTTEVLTGTSTAKAVTPDALAALWEQGGDIASATTLAVGEGGYFHVTGTTTITDIDPATDKAGREFILVFDGALTLTHNASTLILPTGADILTAAGDIARFRSEGTDAVRCVAYQRANGQALAGSGSSAAPWGPGWTEVTFTTSETLHGMTIYRATETFTLAALGRIELAGFIPRTSTNSATLGVSNGTNHGSICLQSDSNIVLYKGTSGSSAIGASGSVGIIFNANNRFEFGMMPTSTTECSIEGAVNDFAVRQNGSFTDIIWGGQVVRPFVVTSDITKTRIWARNI